MKISEMKVYRNDFKADKIKTTKSSRNHEKDSERYRDIRGENHVSNT